MNKCIIEGCLEPRYKSISTVGKKFSYRRCKVHWSKQMNCGRGKRDERGKLLLRWIDKKGYVQMRENENSPVLAEHTYLMQKNLGRSLKKGESVHHKNGIRNDNSLKNLELWIGNVRYGQRAIDLSCPHCGKSYLTE